MEKVKNNSNAKCLICNKFYASKNSLYNHTKKFHVNSTSENYRKISEENRKLSEKVKEKDDTDIQQPKLYNCRKCGKEYTKISSRWSHEKICTETNMQEQINELKEQFAMILQEKGRIHHKTLTKFNNQLNTINSHNTNSNNVNSHNTIHNTYIKFPDLSYEKLFTNKQILKILNRQYKSIEESIKLTHLNEKIPEYNNIYITNLKDDIVYVFDGKKFIAANKNEMLNKLVDSHSAEIELSMERFENDISKSVRQKLKELINKLNDEDTKYNDPTSDKKYSNYKAYKIDIAKIMIYNNTDKKKLKSLQTMELNQKVLEDEKDE